MEERDKEGDDKEAAKAQPASASAPAAPAPEKQPTRPNALEPYWWAPWAVLIGLVLYGLLGYLGVFFPSRKGPTAADVPTTPAPSASDKRPLPAR